MFPFVLLAISKLYKKIFESIMYLTHANNTLYEDAQDPDCLEEEVPDEDGEAGDGRQRPDGGRGPEIRGHAPDVGGAWRRRPTERDEQILKCIDTTL